MAQTKFTYSSRPVTIGELADYMRFVSKLDYSALVRLMASRTEPQVNLRMIRQLTLEETIGELPTMMEGMNISAELSRMAASMKKG